jgi:hypothetical protein
MNGKRVVAILLGGVVVFAALAWAVGLDRLHDAQRRADAAGARKLSETEAARRAAEQDLYGLPSRLPNAPDRAIERPFREGTLDHPFPASAEGVKDLFDVYSVSIRACRPRLTEADRATPELLLYVTLAQRDGVGRVVAVDGAGEGVSTRPFAQCLAGAFGPAVFTAPKQQEVTLAYRLPTTG